MGIEIRNRIECIHCWRSFASSQILWIAEHKKLRDDLRIRDEAVRFLPSRFNSQGNAVDPYGEECHGLACPHCHLSLPKSIIEREVVFVSILGSPSSGKSYYLAALANQIRNQLPKHFGINVTDADLKGNEVLNLYEENLFLRRNQDALLPLGELIPKTQLIGERLYNTVNYGEQVVKYAKPFTFNLDPVSPSPSCQNQRLLCLYDNAGEHFQAGSDSNQQPVTRHMAKADFLLFLYDPMQDARWQGEMNRIGAEKHFSSKTSYQEHILTEAANRVRTLMGLSDQEKIPKPLFVVICKLDIWKSLLPRTIDWRTPLSKIGNGASLNMKCFLEQSRLLESQLSKVIPSIVNVAKSISESTYFVPVSAIGNAPSEFDSDGKPLVRAREIQPKRVTLPILAGLAFNGCGLVEQR